MLILLIVQSWKKRLQVFLAEWVLNKFLDVSGEMVGRDKARGRSRQACAGNAPLITAYLAA
jgi:hypothetical protein